ncbi:hypothetical protein GGF46_000420 [Coemansia sp. RSA 552]|nr:hypothetical protein GGF46_000420 [Coemansia sp. RSA 552]
MLLRHLFRTPGSTLGRATAAARTTRRLVATKPSLTEGEQHIYDKLHQALNPTKLSVADTSGGCGSMYVVDIQAECFRGLSRVKQTQKVNGLLKEELKNMHGMRVLCSIPPKDP